MRLKRLSCGTLMVVLILGVVVKPVLRVTGQDATQMRYGFVFHENIGGEIHTFVAVLNTSNQWTITKLPVALASPYAILGPLNPAWSPDGHRISGTSFESVPCVINNFGDSTIASYGRTMHTFTYPDWKIEHTVEIIPSDILETCPNFEVLRVQSVSPDGRYAWLVKMVDVNRATLVDLETGKILFQPTCPAVVIDWLGSRAIIQNSNWLPHNTYINPNPSPMECPTGLYS